MENLRSYHHIVQYYETDAMGVVHHSNYIRWFEEARLDFLEKLHLPYDEIESRGLLIPVLETSCQYRQAVRFGKTVLIDTRMTFFNGLKFSVEYEIYDETRKIHHASGKTTHCFLNREFHPVRLKREAPDIYEVFEECKSV